MTTVSLVQDSVSAEATVASREDRRDVPMEIRCAKTTTSTSGGPD